MTDTIAPTTEELFLYRLDNTLSLPDSQLTEDERDAIFQIVGDGIGYNFDKVLQQYETPRFTPPNWLIIGGWFLFVVTILVFGTLHFIGK